MKYIETGRGKLPVNYGMFALSQYSEERNLSMDEVFNLDMTKMSLMDVMAFVYAGLKDGARKAGEDCKFNDIADLLDYADTEPDILSKVIDVFASYQKDKAEGNKKK